ncbi:MAG: hypothetical protein PHH13_05200 [Candidatus Peribacteraceae bacterium]|nr:hypothetical protein [Candidatus Peribacteraceae bacterium]
MVLFLKLLRSGWSLLLGIGKPMIVGSVLFGIILFAVQGSIDREMEIQYKRSLISLELGEERLNVLNERMQGGDQTAFDDAIRELTEAEQTLQAMSKVERDSLLQYRARIATQVVAPLRLLHMALSMIVIVFSSAFFFVIMQQGGDALTMVRQALKAFPKIVLTDLWVFFSSLLWLPFIVLLLSARFMEPALPAALLLIASALPALILLPRILPALPIHLHGTAPLESIRESFDRTRAQWGFLIISFFLVIVLLTLLMNIFTGLILWTGSVASLLVAIFGQMQLAYFCAFVTVVSEKGRA